MGKSLLNRVRVSSRASEEGFTLIELIIVVVIIGILSAIAIPIFMNQQKSAIEASLKSDIRNTNTLIATALVKKPTADNIAFNYHIDNVSLSNYAFVWNDGDSASEAIDLLDELSLTEGNYISVVGSYDHYQIGAKAVNMAATELGPRFDNYQLDEISYDLPDGRIRGLGWYTSLDGEWGGLVNAPVYLFDSQLGEIVSLGS